MPPQSENNMIIRSYEDAVEYGHQSEFDVVQYDEFYNSLTEADKRNAPPRFNPRERVGAPFFALYHPERRRPMFVVCDPMVFRFMPMKEIIDDIIGHEKVHVEQSRRKGEIDYKLPSPEDKKLYFSNKEEVMAFSWTIANGLSKTNRSLEGAMKDLDTPDRGGRPLEHKMLWSDIKRYCDEQTIKRYRKYIYMYLEKMFEK